MSGLVIARDSERNKTVDSWGSMAWMANQPLSGSSVAVGRLILHPGFSDSLHSHSNADEVIFLFRGNIRVKIGGSQIDLGPGDALTIPLTVVHEIRNIGVGEAEMTLSYSSGSRKFTSE
jgi:mannose-6-phosphate isomerase-like protein (cupin superfamily)